LEIEVERTPSFVAIRVSDDGSGIDQDDIGLLLQGRIASKDSERPGYGLPSANHIARLHGGRLVYRKSALGGACFEIRV
jgi:signal transduction histidine kinase